MRLYWVREYEQKTYLLNFAEYDNSVTSPIPSASDVMRTPTIAIDSVSAYAITMKLAALKVMANAIRKLNIRNSDE